MQNAKAKTPQLTQDQEAKVEALKELLPKDWANKFIVLYEDLFDTSYTRQHAYNILNGCREDHLGWKVIQKIAADHQQVIEQLA
jgi:hypothetical protein